MLSWSGADVHAVACDRHPDLASTRLGEALAEELGVPLFRVQHHAAHVAAVVAEHGLTGGVLGLAWDGHGYGDDGGSWGGETLWLEGARAERLGHLRPFRLPGGESAIREPRRAALGMMLAAGIDVPSARAWFSETELRTLAIAVERGVNAPWCTSVGRLFDAVAAWTGLRRTSRFEADAAMALEAAALDEPLPSPVSMLRERDGVALLDWEPLARAVVAMSRGAELAGKAGALLVASLAEAARATVLRRAEMLGTSTLTCVLSGGCFLNARLLESVADAIESTGRAKVARASVLPAGDGSVSVGQALLAARRLSSGEGGDR
jgi:hydrogenase maturation protein HypF